MAIGRKKKRGLFASVTIAAMASGILWAQPASAQLIGPCPSPFMPTPCITFDFGRLAQMAQEHAQQIQRLQEMVNQVKEAKAATDSIAGSIDQVKGMVDAGIDIAPGDGGSLTNLNVSNFSATVQDFGKRFYNDAGAGVGETENVMKQREIEQIAANADAMAFATQAREYAASSEKRLYCLSQVSQSSQDLRGDWAVNSQARLEILRQQAQRDQLLSMYLKTVSIKAVEDSSVEQGEEIVLGQTNAPPAAPARSPAWDMQDRLEDIETLIRSAVLAFNIAEGIKTVKGDAKSVQDRYQNAETAREQALNAFRQRAYSWSRSRAPQIVDITVSELNRIDSQLAALRERPISQLSGAFKERNIDAAAMMQNDVDPRQFIGTWGDPLKNKITLDMANNLLDGRLDDWIDGGDDNDEYRDLLLAYNEARLEEAWMRNYASEVGTVSDEINAIEAQESNNLGYAISPEAVKKNIDALVSEANRLAQQIQKEGEDVPTSQAAATLKNIQNILSGGGPAAASPTPTPDPVTNPVVPNPIPTTVPNPIPTDRPISPIDGGPVNQL